MTAVVAEVELRPEYRPFTYTPSARAFFRSRTPETILTGPAGTGKSRTILEWFHFLAQHYPGCRLLIIRKTRASITESAQVTFEQKVVPPGHPILLGATRAWRHSYVYPNGSEIVLGGMDRPDKVLSTEWDAIYFQEAIEATEGEWEQLGARLRNHRIPYQRLVGDTNPGPPKHWIRERWKRGVLELVATLHKDNPYLWDGNDWTPEGRDYMARLDTLSGLRRKRFLLGEWALAEGAIYDNWNPEIHMIPSFVPPAEWTRYWSLDFGHTDPFVWLDAATDHDGRIYLLREVYQTKRIVEDHARVIMSSCRKPSAAVVRSGRKPDPAVEADWDWTVPRPRSVFADHNADGRATFERHTGITTKPAAKSITEGIDEVYSRLVVQGDGRPRLFICRDARIEREDPLLRDVGKPTCTADEVEGYVRKPGEEEPVDKDNHGMDALRYLCMGLATRRPMVDSPRTTSRDQAARLQERARHVSERLGYR